MALELQAPVRRDGDLASGGCGARARAGPDRPRSRRGSARGCGSRASPSSAGPRPGSSSRAARRSRSPGCAWPRRWPSSGAGGDIFLKAREARKPASAASSSSTAATTKKPQKTVPLGNGQGPVGEPGEAVEEEDQRADDERRGGGGDDRALHELADLRGDLGLRQLDLLLDEGLDAGADVPQGGRDGLGAAAVALGQGRGLVLRVGARIRAHRVSRFRTRAATSPPAKAAPARISGCSAGRVARSGGGAEDGVPHRGRLGGGGLRPPRRATPASAQRSSARAGRRSLGRVFPEDPAVNHGGHAGRSDRGERPDAGQEARPDEPLG